MNSTIPLLRVLVLLLRLLLAAAVVREIPSRTDGYGYPVLLLTPGTRVPMMLYSDARVSSPTAIRIRSTVLVVVVVVALGGPGVDLSAYAAARHSVLVQTLCTRAPPSRPGPAQSHTCAKLVKEFPRTGTTVLAHARFRPCHWQCLYIRDEMPAAAGLWSRISVELLLLITIWLYILAFQFRVPAGRIEDLARNSYPPPGTRTQYSPFLSTIRDRFRPIHITLWDDSMKQSAYRCFSRLSATHCEFHDPPAFDAPRSALRRLYPYQ